MRGLNLEGVLEMIRGLPGLPETHLRVMELASDPGASTSDIADIVRTDTSLAARVLQVANTPFLRHERTHRIRRSSRRCSGSTNCL